MNGPPRIVKADLHGFSCAYADYVERPYELGQFVVVREGRYPVLGVVVAVESGPEDPTRPLLPRGGPGETAAEVMAANPEIRLLLRTQAGVVACGYVDGGRTVPLLPPLPAPLLAAVEEASDEEVTALVNPPAFLERLVNEPAAGDGVVAAAVRRASRVPGVLSEPFLVAAGKELARLLRADPARLATLLRGVVDGE